MSRTLRLTVEFSDTSTDEWVIKCQLRDGEGTPLEFPKDETLLETLRQTMYALAVNFRSVDLL